MLDCLPPETLRQILQYLTYQDVKNLENIEQFEYIINRYKVFLPREPKQFEIFCDESRLIYHFNSIDKTLLIPTMVRFLLTIIKIKSLFFSLQRLLMI